MESKRVRSQQKSAKKLVIAMVFMALLLMGASTGNWFQNFVTAVISIFEPKHTVGITSPANDAKYFLNPVLKPKFHYEGEEVLFSIDVKDSKPAKSGTNII